LTKSAVPGDSKKNQFSVRSGLVKEYAEDRYHRQNDQRDRWLAEHVHHEAAEKALADVGKFCYESEDYVKYLVKEPFVEPPREDFSHLLPERMLAAEKKYRRPINIRWILMGILIVSVAIFPSWVTLAIAAAMLVILGFGQYKTLKERQMVLKKTEEHTRQEIETKTRAQEAAISEKRNAHEQEEAERIEFYVRLLNGAQSALIVVLDAAIPKIKLPFPMDVDMDIYGGIILVKAWFPLKSIIPNERTALTENGRILYKKKESTEINKQYVELCAAILMQIITTLCAKIPNVEKIYVRGMTKEGERDECLIALQLHRLLAEKVANAPNALVALKGLSAEYSCDEFLKMLPVKAPKIPEWEGIEQQEISNLHVKIFH